MSYHGWTNRETWAVHLHLTNNESVYHEALAWLKRRESLSEFVSRVAYSRDYMLADVGDMSRVNFREIAEHLLNNP